MYGLVPYNISPIQAGIQFGHSVVEYSLIPEYKEEYLELKNQLAEYDDFWEWYEMNHPETKTELFEQFDKYQESLPDEYFNLNKIN